MIMNLNKLLRIIPIIGLIIDIVNPSDKIQIAPWFVYQFITSLILFLYIISL